MTIITDPAALYQFPFTGISGASELNFARRLRVRYRTNFLRAPRSALNPLPLFGLIADTGHISSFVGGEHSAWLRSGKDEVPQVFRAPGKFNGPLFFLDCALG